MNQHAFRVCLLFLPLTQLLAEEKIEFRYLEMERALSSALREKIDSPHQDTDKIDFSINDLISNGNITELEKFAVTEAGEKVERKKVIDTLDLESGDMIELGFHQEIEANVGRHSQTEFRCMLINNTRVDRRSYLEQEITTGMTIAHNRWHIVAAYGDSEKETVIIARSNFSHHSEHKLTASHQPSINSIRFDFEIYQTTTDEIEIVTSNSAGREERALEWLREKATLVRSASISGRTGQRFSLQDTQQFPHKPTSAYFGPGLAMERLDPQISVDGNLSDLSIWADYRNPENRGDRPDARFDNGVLLSQDTPFFIPGISSDPSSNDRYLMVVTYRNLIVFPGKGSPRKPSAPKEEEPYTVVYEAHPSFPRLLRATHSSYDQRDSNEQSPKFQDLLEKEGMTFEGKSRASFLPGSCSIILDKQSPEEHAKLQAIIEKYTPSH